MVQNNFPPYVIFIIANPQKYRQNKATDLGPSEIKNAHFK
jgi:hypothetical protein